MWGATSEFINKYKDVYDKERETFLSNIPFNQLINPGNRGKYFYTDQPFLWKYVWPRIINTHIAHIKDLNTLKFTGNEKLFPTENPDGMFVGQPIEK
jgi:hypothetical protein